MTMAEFVRKYEVPQDIVREASFRFDNRRDIDEHRMKVYVREIIKRRIETHSDAILSLSKQLARIDDAVQ